MDSVAVALRDVRLERALSLVSVFSVLVVPVLAVYLLRRVAFRSRFSTATAWVLAALGIAGYIPVALVFGVCWGGELGESGKNRLARAYGTTVVVALEQYRRAEGRYPLALSDLTPRFLSPADLKAPENSPLGYPFEYRRDSSTYSLTVRYSGPGMNECTYASDARWHCHGYF